MCGLYKLLQKASATTLAQQQNPSFTRQYKKAIQTSHNNSPILLTLNAIDAMAENFQLFKSCYAADATAPPILDARRTLSKIPLDIWKAFFLVDRITAEITSQLRKKSCGQDNIHIRLLKSFFNTEFISLLKTLFLLCITTGRTPKT
jgi:hypothetical protein